MQLLLKSLICAVEKDVSHLTPIYKSGSKDDFFNYRPISILPICFKILEKVVHKQLYVYITDNQLMYEAQSAFRKHHSTCTARIKPIDKWNMEIAKGTCVGAVFVDLSKAFDMVNHTLLIYSFHRLVLLELKTDGSNHISKTALSAVFLMVPSQP